MGVRRGQAYIEGLRDDRHIYVNGELVRDVTHYPPFQGVIDTLADLYERQHDPTYQPLLTYASPTSGQPVSTSFVIARTWDEMEQRLRGERARCEFTYGLMGRLPDFMNAFVTDAAAVRNLLGRRTPQFGENAWHYYELCREQDLCLTHTLVDPQIDRSKGVEAQEALRVVKETDAGLVVRGARMLSTLAPVSDELWVGPYMPRKPGEEDYALSFAVPVATPGLKFICREPYDKGRSRFDRPLSGRFDEGDAIAIFDDVLVPWERVFAARDVETHNLMAPAFPGYLILQAVIRGTVKLRFLTGLACLVARAVGRTEIPRYQEMLGELIGSVELAEGLLTATAHDVLYNANHPLGAEEARADASAASRGVMPGLGTLFGVAGRGMVGVTAVRLFFPQAMTRAVDTIRLMGSTGLIMTPTEQDFAHPDLQEFLPRHLRGRDMSAQERVQVMRLAWDIMGTQFGSRQFMYEWFFAGDPISSRIVYYGTDRRKECTALAQHLLDSLKKH
ncbi:MAG TPA: 4-hydroxyphenylacetate 3-hydroxylase N-terminal domain-containing protein [Candidatus Binatia bacterium]|jgi:4-hydroxyphenylacetate 3-monooxygenase/anthranilate 3-monooxygenase (FAD)/4-hydroxyphenylacetate 3-monooxygenase|nr:4-hydroxyphenylacetate 3-hydroxylase N-terminal domain-containing protein [Candidatus Binatia bacterium]